MLLVPSKFLINKPLRWQTIWQAQALDCYASSNPNPSYGTYYRVLVNLPGGFAFGGSVVRVSFAANRAGINKSAIVSAARVGLWSTASRASLPPAGKIGPNFAATPAPASLLFSGAADGFIGQGQTLTSDPVKFSFGKSDQLIVEIYSAVGSNAMFGAASAAAGMQTFWANISGDWTAGVNIATFPCVGLCSIEVMA
jgi:hypothetical protein